MSAIPIPDGRLTLGTAISIPTEDLPLLAKRVVLVAWRNEDTPYDDNHLYKCYAASLREAFAHGATSLALPMLGGPGGVLPTPGARRKFREMPSAVARALQP